MINLRRLHHLRVLLEHGHFKHAAKALNISQPALTKSIQALEVELGATLFDRKRGAPALTEFGELVVQRSKPLFAAEADLEREVALLAGYEAGSLKVALGPYPNLMSGYLGISRVLARHPKLSIAVHVAGWREVARQVASRLVDIGIAEIGDLEGSEELATEMIGQHRGRFCCRPGHPLLECDQVSLPQLLAFPWVCTRLPLRLAGRLPKSLGAAGTIDPVNGDFVPAVEVDVPIQLGKFLAGSDALAIVSLTMIAPELKAGEIAVVPVSGFAIQTAYGFLYRRNRTLAPATLAYMREIRAVEAEIVIQEAALAAEFDLQ
jgi:DNA-binding transcriptional LysR family regulator